MKSPALKEKGVEYSEVPRVGRVQLSHFRNYPELDLELGVGFNVLAGANGQGKTNLLEALHLVSTTRLLRGQKDVEAIQEGFDRAEVSIELEPSQTLMGMRIERGTRKRALLNGMGLPRASDILGRLPCVCVSSADMEIARGEPAERRLFLDLELSARSPAYLRHLSVYKRALEQRNAVLREAREAAQPSEVWEIWEDQLAEHGAMVRAMRREFCDDLRGAVPRFHEQIGGGEGAYVSYSARDANESREALLTAYAQTRGQDLQRGSTTIGPHRDDLCFEVAGLDARLFGSQGQQRTLVIALKLATLGLTLEASGTPPLLLLDDIFSDLDERRRDALVAVVLELAGQTLLTCTEASAAGREILQLARVFHVNGGRVT
ncbi:MAG TPA: DNA replication/repair protein RecF [Fimbriimonas sp.]|nr:DNA replication/repair protein RecF [Fimbriimonas sp.]